MLETSRSIQGCRIVLTTRRIVACAALTFIVATSRSLMRIRKSRIGMGWCAKWLLVVATVSGCSWVSRVAKPESCSMTPAVADAALGGGMMFAAFLAYGPQPRNGINAGSLFIGAPATLLSPLALAAAAYGFRHHATCSGERRREAELERNRGLSSAGRSSCEQERLAQFVLATQGIETADREQRLRSIPRSCSVRPPVAASRVELAQIAVGLGMRGDLERTSNPTASIAGALQVDSGFWLRALAEAGPMNSDDSTSEGGALVRAGGGLMMRSCADGACAFAGFDLVYDRQDRGTYYEDGPSLGERVGFDIGGARWRIQLAADHYVSHRPGGNGTLGFGANLSLVVALGGTTTPAQAPAPPTVKSDELWEQILDATLAAARHDCEAARRLTTLPAEIAGAFESDPGIRACRAP